MTPPDQAEKRNLLELLAYLLCEQSIAFELGYEYIGIGLKLYRKTLKDLTDQQRNYENSASCRSSFAVISAESRELAELFYAEKILEMIEKRVSVVNDYHGLVAEYESCFNEEADF